MSTEIQRYNSRKSNTVYIVSEEFGKHYLQAQGEMANNPKVIKQIADVRKSNYDSATTLWIARQLSNTF